MIIIVFDIARCDMTWEHLNCVSYVFLKSLFLGALDVKGLRINNIHLIRSRAREQSNPRFPTNLW